MQKKRPVYDADELDVYQVRWVLGKQRGEKCPLNKGELQKMVDSGRLSAVVLNDEEKELIGLGEVEKDTSEVLRTRTELQVRLMVQKLIGQVMNNFIKDMGNEEWNKLTLIEQRKLIDVTFYTLYGLEPIKFEQSLLDIIKQQRYATTS